jgi:hypothetical protein
MGSRDLALIGRDSGAGLDSIRTLDVAAVELVEMQLSGGH